MDKLQSISELNFSIFFAAYNVFKASLILFSFLKISARNIYELIFKGYFLIDKKNKFLELAKLRVNKTIKSIQLIGNLSNKSHYSYSSEQVSQMMNALDKELKKVKDKFKNSKKDEKKDGFDFKR